MDVECCEVLLVVWFECGDDCFGDVVEFDGLVVVVVVVDVMFCVCCFVVVYSGIFCFSVMNVVV